MTALLSMLWRVLRISVPIPLALIIAAGLWVCFDKASAVRMAVNKAVTELVAGAELDALQAQVIEERRLRAFVEGKAASLAEANKRFEDARIAAAVENEGLADEIEQLKARDVPDGVDQLLFDGLRNK